MFSVFHIQPITNHSVSHNSDEFISLLLVHQRSRNLSVLSDMTSKIFCQILIRTDTRLVFCNRKLMRTDIFLTRTIKTHIEFREPWYISRRIVVVIVSQPDWYHIDRSSKWSVPFSKQLRCRCGFWWGLYCPNVCFLGLFILFSSYLWVKSKSNDIVHLFELCVCCHQFKGTTNILYWNTKYKNVDIKVDFDIL